MSAVGRALLYGFAVLVGILLIVPLVIVIAVSFSSSEFLAFPPPGLSLRWYDELLSRPQWSQTLWTSVVVAALATAISVVVGVCAAVALVRGRFPFKSAIYVAILTPLIVPEIVTSIAMFFLFSDLHLTDTVVAVAIGQSVVALPLVVLMVSATLQGFDETLERAAQGLGATPLVAFRTTTLPIIAPAVLSAALFAFLTSFDNLLIGLFMGGPSTRTLPVQIWTSVVMYVEPVIAAIGTVLVVGPVALFALAAGLRRMSAARGRQSGP
ncbi:ABC transporter permease [Dactylosporangium sp. CA-092794]|uniref:ABC transporter permease n=1 Tax=Dactylosporangium sp. CA-092794 TaxID=3239929 RepID=UPI003D941AAF